MKLKFENDLLLCIAEDWKKLEYNEKSFLSKIAFECITYLNDNGDLQFMLKGYKLDSKILVVKRILALAKEYFIEIDESVEVYLQELLKQEKEEEDLYLKQYKLECKERMWAHRQKVGCEGCEHSKRYGDAWFGCGLSGDDLNVRIAEFYNYKTKCNELFHETGIPNEHCKDFFQFREVKKAEV